MLHHPEHPSLPLIELADLAAPPAEIAADLEPLLAVAGWTESYLSRPHPELGREGPVCPFVPTSRRRGLLYFTVHRGADHDRPAVRRKMLALRDWFVTLEPRGEAGGAMYKAILNLFPDLPRPMWSSLIDDVQGELKPQFVPLGLMIGEFHPAPPVKEGLHNPAFRPLRCPVPLLAIRHLVPTDIGFLARDRWLVEAYLERFGASLPHHLEPRVREVAARHGIDWP